MSNLSRILAAVLCAALPGAVAAQIPVAASPGMPTGPQTRPMNMGENDFASNPNAREQIERATQNASNRPNADSGQGSHVRTRPAKPDELAIGSAVRDSKGAAVGMIGLVDSEGAVVETAAGKVKVPLDAFGMDKKGIVIGITKAEFDSLVARATATPAG